MSRDNLNNVAFKALEDPKEDKPSCWTKTRAIIDELNVCLNTGGLAVMVKQALPNNNPITCPDYDLNGNPFNYGWSALAVDTNKWSFVGGTVAQPLLEFLGEKIISKTSTVQAMSVERREALAELYIETRDEWIDAIETGLFVWSTFPTLMLPNGVSIVSVILSAWPIITSLANLIRETGFERGTYHDFVKQFGSGKIAKSCALFEFFYNSLSLGSTALTMSSLVIDLVYNTVNNNPLDNETQNIINWTSVGASFLLGMVSVFLTKPRQALRFLEGFINAGFYPLMFTTSVLAYIDPNDMNDQGFMEVGRWFTLGMTLLSCLLAVPGGLYNMDDLENKNEDGDKDADKIETDKKIVIVDNEAQEKNSSSLTGPLSSALLANPSDRSTAEPIPTQQARQLEELVISLKTIPKN